MKFMLMMNAPGGGPYQIAKWPEKDIKAHIGFMITFSKKLSAAGELVGGEGLAGPDQAKLVRAGKDGKPVTDGVFPSRREVSGRLLDHRRDRPERAYRSPRLSGARPGGTDEHVDGSAGRGPPQFCEHVGPVRAPAAHGAAGARRVIRHARFRGVGRRQQEALIAAADSARWPPDNLRGWLIHVAMRRMTDHVRAKWRGAAAKPTPRGTFPPSLRRRSKRR